jgi:hypothetical protein
MEIARGSVQIGGWPILGFCIVRRPANVATPIIDKMPNITCSTIDAITMAFGVLVVNDDAQTALANVPRPAKMDKSTAQ